MKDEKDNRVKTAVAVMTAILVFMSMLPVMVSAQSDVKINEIMYSPPGTDADLEWIELYNNDLEEINISGWTVDNNSISDNVMQPGDYVVLARNKTAFEDYYGAVPCPVIDVTFVLANSGDTIVLCDSTGAEVDNVTYNASWGADENGKTLERTAAGEWEESLADGGTPCKLNSVTIVVPFSPWVPPMIYICNITVDAMTPENVGKNATVSLFTSTEMIDNESYYIVNISRPTDYTKMYVCTDAENEDNLMRRVVTEAAPGLEPVNLTFDPAFVMRDFPLWAGKTWTSTSTVTGNLLISDDAIAPVNSTAVVAGKVTLDVVTVPLGIFPCLVLENNISYDVAGVPTSTVRKYWMSTQNTVLLSPKSQTYRNGNLMDELELIEAISPTYANESNNNTTINVTTGEFLVVTLEGNPTTGYTWEVTEPLDELVLRQIGGIVDVPESDLIGAPSKQIATFEVVGTGDTTIKMVYHRPWETEVEPLDTFTLNVTASEV
jgi:inhibitor of cysteine peptidase